MSTKVFWKQLDATSALETPHVYDPFQQQQVAVSLDSVLTRLWRDGSNAGDGGLLFDPVTFADIYQGAEQRLAMDALTSQYGQIERKMNIMLKAMERASGVVKPESLEVREPFKKLGVTHVPAIFSLSDGQTVSVLFHNPDATPNKLAATDEMVAWKWLLNKTDVTITVAKEDGKDLNYKLVASRLMQLAEKNSKKFTERNTNSKARAENIANFEAAIKEKEGQLAELQKQIEDAKAGKADVAPVEQTPSISPETESSEPGLANPESDVAALPEIEKTIENLADIVSKRGGTDGGFPAKNEEPVLSWGVELGYIRRPSASQMEWTERGANEAKLAMMLSGKTVVAGDKWLDEFADRIPDDYVSVPNPNQVGMLDRYLVGHISNPDIAKYREGIAPSTEPSDTDPPSKARNKEIAATILTQLGGANRLKAMLGAKDFFATKDESGNPALSFKIPSRMAKNKANYIKIALQGDDTYTVEFGKIWNGTYKVISTHPQTYAEDFRELFWREMGLEIVLPKVVGINAEDPAGHTKAKEGDMEKPATDQSAKQIASLKNLPPNHVFAEARDMDGNLLGNFIFPHDGTEEGMRKANNKLRSEILPNEFDDWSNSNTRTGATDAEGNPAWVISPNGNHIEPVGTNAASYVLGDVDNKPKEIPKNEPEGAIDEENPHVSTLQSIANGEWDNKPMAEVESALFAAADALEAAGLSEQYDDLIGKASEKYAELDKKANG